MIWEDVGVSAHRRPGGKQNTGSSRCPLFYSFCHFSDFLPLIRTTSLNMLKRSGMKNDPHVEQIIESREMAKSLVLTILLLIQPPQHSVSKIA
jgi:hypothetical protein